MILRTFTVFLLIIPMSSIALSEPPDYLNYIEHTKVLAQTITSIKSCKRMGFNVVDTPTLPTDMTNSALRKAALEGIDISFGESMLVDAIREERQRQDLIAKVPAAADTEDELIAYTIDTMNYWGRRCSQLADDPVASQYIWHTTPAQELEAKTNRINTSVSEIRKAFILKAE
jgi:hypothetical protein